MAQFEVETVRCERYLPYREIYRLNAQRLKMVSVSRAVRRDLKDLNRVRRELREDLIPWERPAGHGPSLVIVARAGVSIVGFAWVVGAWDRMAHVKEVAVLKKHQGQGVGPRLVHTAADWMAELRYESISILPVNGSDAWVTTHGFRWKDGSYEALISDIC